MRDLQLGSYPMIAFLNLAWLFLGCTEAYDPPAQQTPARKNSTSGISRPQKAMPAEKDTTPADTEEKAQVSKSHPSEKEVRDKLSEMGAGSQGIQVGIGKSGIRGVALSGPEMTDEVAAYIGGFTEMSDWLDFGRTGITDDQVSQLKHLTQLHRLQFNGEGRVTNKALEYLEGMTELDTLILSGTSVTADGLKHIAHLTNLQELSLFESPINDEAIMHLKNLTKLKKLNLYGTLVSKMAIEQLKEALPDCSIAEPD